MKLQLLFLISLMLLFNKIDSYSQKTSLLSGKRLNDTAFIEELKKKEKERKENYSGYGLYESERLIPVVFIHPDKNGNRWVVEQRGSLDISTKSKNIFNRMLKKIGKDKNVFQTVFLDNGSEYDSREVFGYTENGKDVFLDAQFRKYSSLKDLLKKRYGSVKRYKEIYNIYEALLEYGSVDQNGCGSRILSRMEADKEIKNNVKNFFVIWGVNVKEKLPESKFYKSFFITHYDKEQAIIHDTNRNERRIGNLKKMKDFCFYGQNYRNYIGGNCND